MTTKWWAATVIGCGAARRELGLFGGRKAACLALDAATTGTPGRIVRLGQRLVFVSAGATIPAEFQRRSGRASR